MKFSEKYELLESLTTGAIETFAANDKVRGERVLVHIVECPPQRPDESTSEWVLESFRRVAPEPAGPILETGKYGGAQYAYLVTKPADEGSVKKWVRRYEQFSEETKETSVHALNSHPQGPPPAMVTPPAEQPIGSPYAPGQMTQLLKDFDSMIKARSSGATPENPRAARPVNLGGESGLHAAPRDPASAKPGEPSFKESVPESFSTPAKPASPERPAVPSREVPKPGEFTSFFQGPFRGDAPADVPAFSSEPIEPPRKTVGEFTALFGQAGPATPPQDVPNSRASATGFTGLFKDMEKPQPTFNSPGGVIPSSIEPLPAPSPANMPNSLPQAPIFLTPSAPVIPEPVISPIPPSPAPPDRNVPARSPSHVGDGATGAFMNPSVEPIPTPVAPPPGPSPYTQIISRAKLAPPESGEALQGHPSARQAGGFAAPPMPKIPAAAPPPLPTIPPHPPIPKVAAPKAPAAPKVSKLDAAPPPAVSYWPLIITLTVLFFLAVILVLYFVLKH